MASFLSRLLLEKCCNLCLGHGCAGAHDAASDFKCNAQLFPHIEVGKVSAQEMALQQGNLFQLLLQKAQTLLPVGQADIQVVDAGAVLLEKITDVSPVLPSTGANISISMPPMKKLTWW